MTNETKPGQENTNSGNSNENPSTQQDEAGNALYGNGSETNTDVSGDDAKKTETEENVEDGDTSDSEPKGDEKEADQEKNTVPDKYELKVEKESLLSKDQVKEIEAYARQQGFSNDQAQALLDREQKQLSSYKESLHKEFDATTQKWVEDLKADKEIGGDNFPKSVEIAKRVVDRFASESFKKALNETGFGNHPELVRTFVKIGQAMAEDTFEPSKGTKTEKTIEDVFYGGN
jgi:phage-related minor tail protein|nr:MAG TPA: putative protease [Caudoviricetes sp.]